MGKVIRHLAKMKIDNYNIFPERFTLEEDGEYHFHYRSVRIAFTPREYKDFMSLMNYSLKKKKQIFLKKIMSSKEDVIDKNKLAVELTKNTYIKHRDDSAKEADFFKDEAYIHVHYRNIRLEFSIAEFIQVSRIFEKARKNILIRNLRDLFMVIDDLAYVVIRNFDNLPDSTRLGSHSDLDLLFASKADVDKFIELTRAVKTFKEGYRVQYRVTIGKKYILCDLRVAGDNYFPATLCADMINNRVRYKGFWIPFEVEYSVALAYHAHIHKKRVTDDYRKKVKYSKKDILDVYMAEMKRPNDRSVGYNLR
jgi:hypothetical protein